MESEDDLDILTALLTEAEGAGEERDPVRQETAEEDLNDLFDNDEDEGEYRDGIEEDVKNGDKVTNLFGDVDDIDDENVEADGEATGSLDKSREDLEEEMRRMQEKMQKLQQQLKASQKASNATSTPGRSTGSLSSPKPSPKPRSPSQGVSRQIFTTKPPPSTQKTKTQTQTVKPLTTPERQEGQKMHDSSDFSAQLNNADSFKRKPRVAHQTSPPEDRCPLVEIKIGSTFLPKETSSNPLPKSSGFASSSTTKQIKPTNHPPAPKDVAVEKYSGLRLRRPRVSSTEMDNKMANRRMIRLSQVPERLAKEKLEDSDWVTFAVLVSKATPQSNSSGKTFSIWKLNDLHNLDVYVSLLLFGEVHKEHWKTEPGTVIGVLNPNPMKQKDGYDGVSLSVDHPQKVMLMGEAIDFGTCKAAKKNGEPCSQLVNLYECQYCQYHVKAQYKKMSSKRSELQSSFSGKATGKVKAKGGSLKERLCNEGFYYGGVSSSACATALSKPNKSTQGTLDKLFVKGSAQLVNQAKILALKSGEVSGCTDDFKSLMAAPTPGALQLKKHLIQAKPSGAKGTDGAGVQSITASELIKQQKQKQLELLENRKRRAEEIQKRVSQNTTGAAGAPGPSSSLPGPGGALLSPKAASKVPKATAQSPAVRHAAPTLGRGFSEGEDILFFDHSPPPAPNSPSLSAAKLAALRKLRAKGALAKEDPNAVKTKRKRSDGSDISARVEKNLVPPDEESSGAEGDMPAQKKRREQLEYVESEEFQKILNAKSRHNLVLQAAEYQLQERYFDVLVKKEQMEDKMRDTKEMKCRAVSCKKCNYTYFKPADRCVEQNHALKWHDATKRFFKCPCGQRAIALDRLPHKHCSNCGQFKWERDGMLKEKKGPKLGGELLQPRGEEQPKFLNSMQ